MASQRPLLCTNDLKWLVEPSLGQLGMTDRTYTSEQAVDTEQDHSSNAARLGMDALPR